jgi:hypothetical protein
MHLVIQAGDSVMPRRRVAPAFCQSLRDAGWLTKITPDPMLMSLGLDEYIFIERTDRLVYLHISADTVSWEAKRYSREPFGDYTTVYQPLGSGVGLASLQKFLKKNRC